ncbi:unnamed protein product [Lepidochelys kempii]
MLSGAWICTVEAVNSSTPPLQQGTTTLKQSLPFLSLHQTDSCDPQITTADNKNHIKYSIKIAKFEYCLIFWVDSSGDPFRVLSARSNTRAWPAEVEHQGKGGFPYFLLDFSHLGKSPEAKSRRVFT